MTESVAWEVFSWIPLVSFLVCWLPRLLGVGWGSRHYSAKSFQTDKCTSLPSHPALTLSFSLFSPSLSHFPSISSLSHSLFLTLISVTRSKKQVLECRAFDRRLDWRWFASRDSRYLFIREAREKNLLWIFRWGFYPPRFPLSLDPSHYFIKGTRDNVKAAEGPSTGSRGPRSSLDIYLWTGTR